MLTSRVLKRAATSVLSALLTSSLALPQSASAAPAPREPKLSLHQAAKNLGVPLAMLQDPEAWHARERVESTLRHAEGLKKARAFAKADGQDARAKAAREVADGIRKRQEGQRLQRATSKAAAMKLSPDKTKALLQRRLRNSRPPGSRPPQGPRRR